MDPAQTASPTGQRIWKENLRDNKRPGTLELEEMKNWDVSIEKLKYPM